MYVYEDNSSKWEFIFRKKCAHKAHKYLSTT